MTFLTRQVSYVDTDSPVSDLLRDVIPWQLSLLTVLHFCLSKFVHLVLAVIEDQLPVWCEHTSYVIQL
jgi:hypothetical protein